MREVGGENSSKSGCHPTPVIKLYKHGDKNGDATHVSVGADAKGIGASSLSSAQMRQRSGTHRSKGINLGSVPMFHYVSLCFTGPTSRAIHVNMGTLPMFPSART